MNCKNAGQEHHSRGADPHEWLAQLHGQITAAGGADTIIIVEGESPRVRRAAGQELEPLDGAPPLDAEQLNALVNAILRGGAEQALAQTGEAEMPLESWRTAGSSEWWVAHVFMAQRGRRRVILRRYATADQWLKDQV